MPDFRHLRFLTYAVILLIAFLTLPGRRFIPLNLGGSAENNPEAAALEQREIDRHNAALARLPKFDSERLQAILAALRTIKYPITFNELRTRLGGPDSLVWCCTQERLGKGSYKSRSTYHVALSPSNYLLVVDFASTPDRKKPSVVMRTRLRYESPFGWGFTAESEDDYLSISDADQTPTH